MQADMAAQVPLETSASFQPGILEHGFQPQPDLMVQDGCWTPASKAIFRVLTVRASEGRQ